MKAKTCFTIILLFGKLVIFNLCGQYGKLFEFSVDNPLKSPKYTHFIADGSTLYGMTYAGGENDMGTIFKINTDGSGYEKLLDFDGISNGANPYGSLTQKGDSLYGMTYYGGANYCGVIFRIKTDGSGYQKLLDFESISKGARPYGSLTLSGDTLYGMTSEGGTNYKGVIFKISTSGSGYQKLLDFDGYNKGANPYGSLILSGDSLYGMTCNGGEYNYGVIFRIKTGGSGYQKLLDFNGTSIGANPYGSLTMSGDSLYGMTCRGGSTDNTGVIFKIRTSGSNFQVLLRFGPTKDSYYPSGSLTLSKGVLYGMTEYGGVGYVGVIFKISTAGSGYQKLLEFNGKNRGAYPLGSLTLSGDSLYGMTTQGGAADKGVIFKISTGGSGYQKLLDLSKTKGAKPVGLLTFSEDTVYGMTNSGAAYGYGSIFKMSTNGSGYKALLDFDGTNNGSAPYGSLILSGDWLYGMNSAGGSNNYGVIFKIKSDGSGYQKLLDFNGANNGAIPHGSLTLSGDWLYGMTRIGGVNDKGVIFKININGSGYQKLLDFDGTNKGNDPRGSLTLSGDSLYGMTAYGGANTKGVIFKIITDGSGYQKLLDFDGTNNGANPTGSLILSGGALYGMTYNGGVNGYGVIFKISTNGSGYQKLFNFDGTNNGAWPWGSLTIAGDSLYGMTYQGGVNGTIGSTSKGVIFKINTDGSRYQKLLDFDGANNGANPWGSLTLKGDSLFGVTSSGGSADLGTIFIYRPIVQATNLQFTNVKASQMDISFTTGDGVYRAVFMNNGTTGSPSLTNNIAYSADPIFGQGSQAGSGWYCVANGTLSGNSFRVTGLTPSTAYRIMVVEYNIDGAEVRYSMYTVSGNPANQSTTPKEVQTITFNTLTAKTYGDADFDPAATASSGLTISYASSNTAVATIVLGQIHITGAGTADITASQSGNGNFNAAVAVVQTLIVNKISQTITFNALSTKTYGNADFDPAATAGSGLAVTYASSNPDVATIVSGQIHIIGAGTADITASQSGNGNYNAAADVVQTLTVNKASQTITFNALAAKTWGDADFDPAATAGSGLAVTYASSNSDVATIVSGQIHIIGVGTADITASQSGNGNYNAAANVVQTLTVSKASQAITFNALVAKTYGDIDFNPAAIVSSGLTITYASSNTTVATIVTGQIHIIGTGTADITASQPGNGNYNAAANVVQTLTVNKSSQTISFNALSNKTYGDADFDPAATAGSGLAITYASSNTAIASIVSGQIHIIGAGTADITASQSGNGNYNAAADVVQTLTVNKASQTITFNALPAKTWGDADFDPAATAGSGLAVTYASSNTAVVTVVTGQIHIIGAGTADITASQSGNVNYNAAANVVQTLTVNKASQTITFNALPAKTWGDIDFDPAATAGSGLAVTYASSNTAIASIVSGQIHIIGAGTADITASQSGNGNYNAAADVVQTLVVNKANQTITFNALSTKTYGYADFDPAATAGSGLAVTYASSNTAIASIVSGQIHIIGAGTADITASQSGNGNYNAAANVVQTLTVNKASQAITFNALSTKTYGAADFDPSATAGSGLAVTYASSNTAVVTIVTGQIHIIGTGTADITASQPGNGNYNAAADVVQTLTVNKSSQTISFNALSNKTYGDADFDPAATAGSGLAITYASSNTAIASIVSGQIHIIGAGTADITASQSGNGNYNAAADVVQTLTVNKASQTITFNALPAKTWGDVDFELVATASSGLAVTYASSNTAIASIVSGQIRIIGAGTADITASQPGNDNYNAAANVVQTLTVNKASQTITFNALPAKTWGDVDFDPAATAGSGLAVTYASSNTAVVTIVTGQIHIIGAGTADITASQSGNGNYNAAADVVQTLTVNKASQTITFNALPAKTWGDADFELVATASSGLAVTYASSNTAIASIVSGQIHIIGAGTADITASQSGNGSYNAAASVVQTLIINKSSQTITFNNLPDKTYGDIDFDPAATAGSGLAVTYASSNTAIASIVSGQIHIIGAGTADITASQSGNGNYNDAADVVQSLTVNKANQTIIFNALPDKTYGDVDFNPAASTNSGLAVTYASSNTAVVTIVTGQIHITGAGSSDITVSQSGNGNFDAAADVIQNLTVNKATLTVTADNMIRKVGENNPVFTITFNGWVDADNASDIEILPIATCLTTATSPPGDYEINVSGGADNNYTFNYVKGTLTIEPLTDVNSLSDKELIIYPNPANDKLYIYRSESKPVLVQIINIEGKVILIKSITNQVETIDVSAFSKGTYMVKIVMNDESFVKKIEVR